MVLPQAGAEAVDLRLSRLASSKMLQMKLDEIQTRPPQVRGPLIVFVLFLASPSQKS
jgi:hypothetical protein